MSPAAVQPRRETAYARDLGRAFGGALLFSLPLLMTMEMWWFGFTLHPARLALFLLAAVQHLALSGGTRPGVGGVALDEAGWSRIETALDALLVAFPD